MATGAYDSNGIYKYGEDDNISLFSTTLNKLADSVSAAETADRARLATLEAGSLSGLIPLKASTVTATSGTASVSLVGQVTGTGVTDIRLDGVFSAEYKNYLATFAATGAGQTLLTRMIRNGVVDSTAGNYTWQRVYAAGTNLAASRADGDSQLQLCDIENSYGVVGNINFYRPFETYTRQRSQSVDNGSTPRMMEIAGIHFGTLPQTGFLIRGSAGLAMNITVSVYGYND